MPEAKLRISGTQNCSESRAARRVVQDRRVTFQFIVSCGSGVSSHLDSLMNYSPWWISAQYVNTLDQYTGFTGCHGGPAMKVAVGDILDIDMALSGTVWKQIVTDEATSQSVSFDWDLLGQDEDWALFVIEDTYNSPSEDLIFRSTILTFASPAGAACVVGSRGTNDYVVTPRTLSGGLECCVSRMVLRGKGVAASSPN